MTTEKKTNMVYPTPVKVQDLNAGDIFFSERQPDAFMQIKEIDPLFPEFRGYEYFSGSYIETGVIYNNEEVYVVTIH